MTDLLSTSNLTFLLVGFFIGAAFLIVIFNIISKMFGGGQGGRRGRRDYYNRRHYDREDRDRRYYEDDDYDEGRNLFPLILLLIVLVIGGAALAQKAGLFQAQKDGAMTSKLLSKMTAETPDTIATVHQPKQPVKQSPYILHKGGPTREADEKYFILVAIVDNIKDANARCREVRGWGFSACTMNKAKGIAIYAGPYPTSEEAQRVNLELGGVVEVY